MSLKKLLTLLADGQLRSGEEIGQVLGVSRTAIWKQLKKCQSLGLEIETIRGKGYQINGGIELLDKQRIQPLLSETAKSAMSGLELFFEIGSTNLHAMEVATTAPSSGYVCAGEMQTDGRGRRGKAWVSPFARNLYFSIVWQFESGISALEGLSLAVGVALTNALRKAGVTGTNLKWPNDVLYEDKKLAGILLEVAGDPSGSCQLVIGVGLNVNMSDADGKAIDQEWIDVAQIVNMPVSRNKLFAGLLNSIFDLLSSYEKLGFAHYQSQWAALDAFADREVALALGERIVFGRAQGVNASGALCLLTDTGKQYFSGGEVSLRRV